jgi:hypothetical protein
MLRSMSVTPEGIFALAACGENVTLAFDTGGHDGTFDTPSAAVPADVPGKNARVSVQRTSSAPGICRYQCTIHPGRYGSVGLQ